MAGSYNHVVHKPTGRLLPPDGVCGMLEARWSGDVYECVEEMYGMIWYLAHEFSELLTSTKNGHMTPALLVEEARNHYQDGLENSPGKMRAGEPWGEEDDD